MARDDAFFRAMERNNRRETRDGRTQFVKEAEEARDNDAADPNDFRGTGLVPDAQINADIKKAQELEEKYGKPGFIASALELVVNRGIDTGAFFSIASQDGVIESINTSKYDDYINRVDTAATIHHSKAPDLTFAIDLYSGDDGKKALQKIARSSNRIGSNIFAGFTEIRYYEDSNGKKRLKNVPRYCIGVDQESILAAVDTIDGTGNLFQTTNMDEIRFKMLYEMSQQNGLYTNYLYEYADNFETQAEKDPDFQQAISTMQTLDNLYLQELDDAKKKLGPAYSKLGINAIAKQFMQKDKTFKTIVNATEALMADKEGQAQEKNAMRARQGGRRILQALKRIP